MLSFAIILFVGYLLPIFKVVTKKICKNIFLSSYSPLNTDEIKLARSFDT